jgi:hypothetical protein
MFIRNRGRRAGWLALRVAGPSLGSAHRYLLQSSEAPAQASAIEKQLFPDQATLRRDEHRRWELTEVHWDLPIRQVDPNGTER